MSALLFSDPYTAAILVIDQTSRHVIAEPVSEFGMEVRVKIHDLVSLIAGEICSKQIIFIPEPLPV